MNDLEYKKFSLLKNSFIEEVASYSAYKSEVISILNSINKLHNKSYKVDCPFVYNKDWESVSKESKITLILVADNPGCTEQQKINLRYLIGKSGVIARGFFNTCPQLNITTKNILILNKTFLHSAKSADLKTLLKLASPELKERITSSMHFMAHLTYSLSTLFLQARVWIIGYSECKRGGVFFPYMKTLNDLYGKNNSRLFFYKHFSMGGFNRDINRYYGGKPDNALITWQVLDSIGVENKKRLAYDKED